MRKIVLIIAQIVSKSSVEDQTGKRVMILCIKKRRFVVSIIDGLGGMFEKTEDYQNKKNHALLILNNRYKDLAERNNCLDNRKT